MEPSTIGQPPWTPTADVVEGVKPAVSTSAQYRSGLSRGKSNALKGKPTMLKTLVKLQNRIANERGATAVEYGLMVALIAIVIIAAVTLLGQNISALFDDAATQI